MCSSYLNVTKLLWRVYSVFTQKCFRLYVNVTDIHKILSPSFWPKGVDVREYVQFPRKQRTDVTGD